MDKHSDFLKLCVYYDGAFGNRHSPLPGERLLTALEAKLPQPTNIELITSQIYQSARKLALMWTAGDLAEEAEQEFYSATFHDAPSLFGEDAVKVHCHLEALSFLPGQL